MVNLMQGDCLDLMKDIPDSSIDMILCDLPYGITRLEWDNVIPFEPLWEQYKRVAKKNAAIVLFSAQPFTTDLINSNRKMFRYEIIWEKTKSTGFLNAKKMPLRVHENILLFYRKLPTYNPQKIKLSDDYIKKHSCRIGTTRRNSDSKKTSGNFVGKVSESSAEKWIYTDTGERYPTDVIKLSNPNQVKHPTAKPVPLLEWLIKTYSNEGDTVLDNCMGSGSTGVACINTGRNFIGIENNDKYFDISQKRISQAKQAKQAL